MNILNEKDVNSSPIIENKSSKNITGKNFFKVILGIPVIVLTMALQGLVPVLLFGLAKEIFIGMISSKPLPSILLTTVDLLKEPKIWLIAIVIGLFGHIKD